MGQPHWKPLHWTKWKREHKGPIGCIVWMTAPYTCEWYTLSGHPSTSSHSCCCCWAEWISQRKEGLRTANGVCVWVGGGGFIEGGCWVKGDLALGKDWLKAICILGLCLSISPPSLLLTPPPPTNLIPFQPGSSVSIKGVSGGRLSHIYVRDRGTKNWWQLSDTWIGSLNPGCSWYRSLHLCTLCHPTDYSSQPTGDWPANPAKAGNELYWIWTEPLCCCAPQSPLSYTIIPKLFFFFTLMP